MNPNIFHMSAGEMGTALLIGAACSIVFMYLLWETIQLLPRVKHRGLFLFVSMALRIFLLLAVMILFSGENAGRFILIFCGFVIMRLFILRFTRFGAYNQVQEKQLQKSFGKKKGKR